MAQLEGQTYLVTGASRGIGKALSLKLASEGASVVLLARQSADLEAAASEVQSLSPDSYALPCDLSESASVEQAAASVCDNHEAVHGLVHNAGDIHPIKSLLAADPSQWRRSLAVNIVGVQHLTQALASVITNGHRVRITTISSGAALRPLPSWSAYCTAKAALDMWTRCMALEGAEHGISAVSVAPGIVDTGMQDAIRSASEDDFPLRNTFVGYKEDGQLTHAGDVADQLFQLVTEHTMNESGQRFDVRDL